MIWLLLEILVFVVAAAVFGGLIGLGLAGTRARRSVVTVEREHQTLIDGIASAERAQRQIEAKAVARAAAEAAARGDLESRLVEMETAASDYRARAEAAERRIRAADSPAPAAELIDPRAAAADATEPILAGTFEVAAAHNGERAPPDIEAERAFRTREIESLRAQLASAERVRARTESDLAVAKARTEDMMRAVSRVNGEANAGGDDD